MLYLWVVMTIVTEYSFGVITQFSSGNLTLALLVSRSTAIGMFDLEALEWFDLIVWSLTTQVPPFSADFCTSTISGVRMDAGDIHLSRSVWFLTT